MPRAPVASPALRAAASVRPSTERPEDRGDDESDERCNTCMQDSKDGACSCARWQIGPPPVAAGVPSCGEGLLARVAFAPGTLVLHDPTAALMHVRIVQTREQETDEAANDKGKNGNDSPPPTPLQQEQQQQLTWSSAPNAAAATIPLLARLVSLLRASQPQADARSRRLGALVRRLHWEPLEELRARDPASANLLGAMAAMAVDLLDDWTTAAPAPPPAPLPISANGAAAVATTMEADQISETTLNSAAQQLRRARVALMERLLSSIKLNSFLCREAAPTDEAANVEGQLQQQPQRQHLVLMLLVASVNHSCMPNAVLLGSELRTISHVAAGEQVLLSYLNDTDLATLDVHQRRAKLHYRWGFVCHCNRCVREAEEEAGAEAEGSSLAVAEHE